jgi:hypothetical protein
MGLGSFTQCDPVEVTVSEWKPQYYLRSNYDAQVASEEDTVDLPFVEVAEKLEDLSHQEAEDVLAAQEEKAASKSNSMKFWVAAGVAALILK